MIAGITATMPACLAPEPLLGAGAGLELQPRPGRQIRALHPRRDGQRRDDRVGEHLESPRRDTEDSVVHTGGGPDPLVLAEILIHQDPNFATVPERRNPAHGEARKLARLANGSLSNGNLPRDRGQQREIYLVPAGHEADDRNDPAFRARSNEDERLHDLPDFGIDSRCRLLRRVGRTPEDADIQGHPLASGDLDNPLNCWMREIGHVSKSTIRSTWACPRYRLTQAPQECSPRLSS